TGAHKQSQNFFQIAVVFEDEQNRFFWIKHPTRPNGEDWRTADVERAGDVTAAKREHRPNIDKLIAVFSNHFFELLWRQTANARQTPKHFRSFCVHLFHSRIISRHRWRSPQRVIGEFLHVVELKEFIVAALITDRAGQTRTD